MISITGKSPGNKLHKLYRSVDCDVGYMIS